MIKNTKAIDGVYFWTVTYKLFDGIKESETMYQQGTVTLMR
jgi:hypothetical protein